MDAKTVKRGGRKTLHTLQIAVGRSDKENLTRRVVQMKKGEMKNSRNDNEKKEKKIPDNTKMKNKLNKIKCETVTKETAVATSGSDVPIIAEDLTTDTVSDNYWKHLAESRRVALDSALKENVDLHNKVTELEYENTKVKELLEEAKSLVQVLTEMLEEGESTAETSEASHLDTADDGDAESDLDDVSFRSCV